MVTKAPPKAAAAAAPAEEAAPAPKKGGSKKLVMILAAVIVLAAGGGGAAWYFLKSPPAGDKPEAQKHVERKPPVFVNLEPFTVNLQSESGADQFLQLVVVLRIAEEGVSEQIKTFMPELRHKTLLLLSGKRASEISAPDGREKLADELRDAINTILKGAGESAHQTKKAEAGAEHGPVQSVFFTSFIVQ